MNTKEMAFLDISTDTLHYLSTETAAALSSASKKLSQLREEINNLKRFNEDAESKPTTGEDFQSFLNAFMHIIPDSIRGRIKSFANNLEGHEENLSSVLIQEAYSLLLYDAIFYEIDNRYDLPNLMLSRIIRSCIDNYGKIPQKTNMALFANIQPKILNDIEDAFQRHTTLS